MVGLCSRIKHRCVQGVSQRKKCVSNRSSPIPSATINRPAALPELQCVRSTPAGPLLPTKEIGL